jgi:hypothetical protein
MAEGQPANVVEALARVMEELPAIAKRPHPSPDGRGVTYAYRGIEEVTAEVQGLFAKYGVVAVPHVDEIEVVDILVNDRPWTDTRLTVTYHVYGPGGLDDCLTARVTGIGRDNSDKGSNKALTQCFKYLLLQVLCISDSADDADGTTTEADAPPARRAAAPPRSAPALDGGARPSSDGQRKAIYAICKARGMDNPAEHAEVAGAIVGREITDTRELSMSEARRVIDQLKQGE